MAWNRVFPCSCVVILNQVRSVVIKQLTNKRSYRSKSADGFSKRASDFSMPGYQLNLVTEMTELVRQRAQRNGGKIESHIEKCEGIRLHTLSVQWACFKADVKQIECIEVKLTKVTQDMEALENKKTGYDSIFKGIHKQHAKEKEKRKSQKFK